MIVGIDEVGRGAWAGPLVVGAVMLSKNIDGLTDSKLLSKAQREIFAGVIKEKAEFVGLGWVWPSEIDELGLTKATTLAIERSLENLTIDFSEIVIDGKYPYLGSSYKERPCTVMASADLYVPAVSAASIVAKVARDSYMAGQALEHAQYGFDMHVGYGTVKHRLALASHGLTPLHRRSYKPIQALT